MAECLEALHRIWVENGLWIGATIFFVYLYVVVKWLAPHDLHELRGDPPE